MPKLKTTINSELKFKLDNVIDRISLIADWKNAQGVSVLITPIFSPIGSKLCSPIQKGKSEHQDKYCGHL